MPTSTTTFSLGGRVTNRSTSAGIAGAAVSIVDGPNAGKSTATDGSGNYKFTSLQQSGFTVAVSASNYVSQSSGITLTSNQTLDVSLMPVPASIVLTGHVTDAITSALIAGAIVSINGRYRGMTDGSGNYSVTGLLDYPGNDFTYVSATNYASDYRYIRGTTQNVRLYRIERIPAGEATMVTIAPDDTLCVNNVQDSPDVGVPNYVCRGVRVVTPSDGTMTVEALSTQGGSHPPLEVEIDRNPVDWSQPFRNPTSFAVTAGKEVVVNVEMLSGSTASQSFVLTTSMAQR
jgi:hypothetical protein